MIIVKAKETMSAKERVRRTFAHEKTDRLPIGYEANGGIHSRLCDALGVDGEGLLQALGVDYRGIDAPYIGEPLFPQLPNRIVDGLSGAIMRWVEHESGGYWDYCDFRLKDASEEIIRGYPVPSADDFDYSNVYAKAKALGENYALHVGNPGLGDIMNSLGMIMGVEDAMCGIYERNAAVLDFIDRRAGFQLANTEHILRAAKGEIDFMWLGEDLGSQHAPLISLQLYREVLRPIHQRFVDLAKSYGVPVIVHTCGSSSWVYNDFIQMGVSGVDTLQPEAANMSPEYLKKTFGDKLCYRGCISTAGPVAYGVVDEVVANVNATLDIMTVGGGYFFAPTHALQDNSPTENVIAMYQAAHDYKL